MCFAERSKLVVSRIAEIKENEEEFEKKIRQAFGKAGR